MLMFSRQIWDATLTDSSKIGDEFEQNYKYVSSFIEIKVTPYLDINRPLDSTYLADFGIDITALPSSKPQ